jgi:hypothetical protein
MEQIPYWSSENPFLFELLRDENQQAGALVINLWVVNNVGFAEMHLVK